MNNLTLVRPCLDLCDSYRSHVDEFLQGGEQLIPFPLTYPNEDSAALLLKLQNQSQGIELAPGFIPNSTFWLAKDDREVVGVSNLRHELTDSLRIEGGHIGYGVRPSQRGHGYGNEILRLTVDKARQLGLTQVLVTCDKTNVVSAAVIRHNGGILRDEEFRQELGETVQRYWITLS